MKFHFPIHHRSESYVSGFNQQLARTFLVLDNWHKFRFRLFIEGIFVGVFGGLCISLFRFLLMKAEALRTFIYSSFLSSAPSGEEVLLFVCLLIMAMMVIGAALYGMCLYAPMASGSGIPQVKGVILGLYKMKWFRILWVKIIAGALGIGAGLSLGREGPSIQIGAVAGQGFSRFLGRTRMEERYLITAGSSAGLAAAFNAPLAGMMFSLEELHRNFSGAVLLPTMTSAVTATIVTRFFFGNGTSFHFSGLFPMPAEHLPLVVVVAITAGLAGIVFNWGLLHVDRFYGLPIFRNQYHRILFALFCAAVLAFTLPEVLGGGNALVDALTPANYPLRFLLLLLVAKYLFTLVSYGTGVPGGFFLPLLVVGALLGAVEANVLITTGFLSAVYLPNMIIIGMVALFAASVRSPITGTLLILEMTGDFGHLMALALASAVAYITAEVLGGEPIYDALLAKSLKSAPDKAAEEERGIVEVPVESGSLLEGKPIGELPRVKQAVIVDLKRHGQSLIPDPDIRLAAGDFLYVLTLNKNAEMVKQMGAGRPPEQRGRS